MILMLAGLSIAAINRAVAWVYLDKPATIRAAANSVLPRLRTLPVADDGHGIPRVDAFCVLYVAFFAIAVRGLCLTDFLTNPPRAQTAAQQQPRRSDPGLLAWACSCSAVLPFAASLYGVWMSLRYSLAVPACVVEGFAGHRRDQAQHRSEPGLARTHLRAWPSGLCGARSAGNSLRVSLDRSSRSSIPASRCPSAGWLCSNSACS